MPFPSPWKPVADFEYSSEPFFDGVPDELMEAGKVLENVPLLMGFNKDEGLIVTANMLQWEHMVKQLE